MTHPHLPLGSILKQGLSLLKLEAKILICCPETTMSFQVVMRDCDRGLRFISEIGQSFSLFLRHCPIAKCLERPWPCVGCFSRCEASVQQLLGMEEGRNHCHKCDRPSSSSPLRSSLLFSPNHIGSFRQEILPPPTAETDPVSTSKWQAASGSDRPTDCWRSLVRSALLNCRRVTREEDGEVSREGEGE